MLYSFNNKGKGKLMFKKEFPRIYELLDQIEDPKSLNVFWRNFDVNLKEYWFREMCLPYEKALQTLDFAAWEFLKKEASAYQIIWDEENGRGQQQLINILNQARAYSFLRNEIGCSDIHFIPWSKIQGVSSPDLEGSLGQIKVICEVKTINISNDEVSLRQKRKTVRNKYIPLEEGFFDKLMYDIKVAKNQIEAYDKDKQAIHIVYIILNLDNFWGEHKEKHYQEIDNYLGYNENIIHGIKIVFHNQPMGYPAHITMKFATIVNEADCVSIS
jgi:hypothetical protein